MRQLSRIALEGATGSADEHVARPQEEGGYGELVEEIDRLLEKSPKAEEPPSSP